MRGIYIVTRKPFIVLSVSQHFKPLVLPPLIQRGRGKEPVMGKMSRDKGKRGERELANILKEYGYDCRRGQQYCGGNGDADVIGLPGIHIECKRVEHLNLSNAMDQAVKDSGANDLPFGYPLPAVFHRKNNYTWLVTMRLCDWSEMRIAIEKTDHPLKYRVECVDGSKKNIHNRLDECSDRTVYDFVIYKEIYVPIIVHPREPETDEWLVTMNLADWIALYREHEIRSVD